jgi:serine/threonine-protein kinase
MSEETLFHEALARPSVKRAAFLDAACAGPPQNRAAVDALLAAHERSGHVLDQPPQALGQSVDPEPELLDELEAKTQP